MLGNDEGSLLGDFDAGGKAVRRSRCQMGPNEQASNHFVRVVYHSLADKTDQKKPLLKRILHRS